MNCTHLKNINLPSSIKRIEDYTFANCKSLSTFVVTETLEYISENAFQNCINLNKFNVHRDNMFFFEDDDKLYILSEGQEKQYIIQEEEYNDELDIEPSI